VLTRIFWANLTPFSMQRYVDYLLLREHWEPYGLNSLALPTGFVFRRRRWSHSDAPLCILHGESLMK
jgi:hypothetical protein